MKTAPYPHHCRVLEAMFPEYGAEELLAPPTPGQLPLSSGSASPLATDVGFATTTAVEQALASWAENPERAMDPDRSGGDRPPGQEDDVRRRDLLNLVGGTAALALLPGLGETTRRGLERLLPSGASDRDLDDWERTVDMYGVEICAVPPTLMLQQLLTDIGDVRDLLDGRASSPAHRRLLWVAAQLSVLTAVTIIATGAPQAGRRWWRTARRDAEQVGDAELEAFVLGQQAVLAMYCGYSHEQVLDLADEALSPSGRDLICAGAASAIAARAQALSALGREQDARHALDRLRHLLDRLPDQTTTPVATWFAYPEYKLRHVESYVNTRLGRPREAARAQDAALVAYPEGKYRGISQVELHRAACMIMDGDIEDGIRHATATLRSLPANLRGDGLIHNVAQAALAVVPTPARSLAPVADYRQLLTATSTGRSA